MKKENVRKNTTLQPKLNGILHLPKKKGNGYTYAANHQHGRIKMKDSLLESCVIEATSEKDGTCINFNNCTFLCSSCNNKLNDEESHNVIVKKDSHPKDAYTACGGCPVIGDEMKMKMILFI